MNHARLFLASCLALIVTAMSFAIRGDIMGALETEFALSKRSSGGSRERRSGASPSQ